MISLWTRNKAPQNKKVLLMDHQVEAIEMMASSLSGGRLTMTVGEVSNQLHGITTPGSGPEEFHALMHLFNLRTGSPAEEGNSIDLSIISQTDQGLRDLIVEVPHQISTGTKDNS